MDMTASESCPLCAAALGESKAIDVCTYCHAGLEMCDAGVVSTTGEFTAVTDPTLSSPMPGSRSNVVPSPGEAHCCWCDKTSDKVRKMLSQGGYHICNECVALCADILKMELGDDFG